MNDEKTEKFNVDFAQTEDEATNLIKCSAKVILILVGSIGRSFASKLSSGDINCKNIIGAIIYCMDLDKAKQLDQLFKTT